MNETRPAAEAGSVQVEPRRSRAVLIWLLLPLAVLTLAIAWLVTTNPLSRFDNGAPPVESLTFERTVLSDGGIDLLVRAGGSEPMTIAQVQVDDAYWQFVQEPAGPLGRGETAWIRLPYPWVLGEAHAVKMITNTGATFDHEIAVAVPTPVANTATLWSQMLLGAFVGIVPVAIGLMFYPALRGVGRGGMNFLLAMTVGLLVFLMIDAAGEALELAGEAAAIFQGHSDFPPATILTSVTTDFKEREPEVAEMLSKLTFKTDTMSGILAWMDENNASGEEAAVYFLSNNSDTWSTWLNDDARERLAKILN